MISLIAFLNTARADTIDFWHVYYNKIKLGEYGQNTKGAIALKIKNIKKSDSLTIKYFRDTPCIDCETIIAVEDKKRTLITKGKGRGTLNPLKISVYKLLKYYLQGNKGVYDVYYQEEQSKRLLLFTIEFYYL